MIGDKYRVSVKRKGECRQFTVIALTDKTNAKEIKEFLQLLLEECVYPDVDGSITCNAPVVVSKGMDKGG